MLGFIQIESNFPRFGHIDFRSKATLLQSSLKKTEVVEGLINNLHWIVHLWGFIQVENTLLL